MKYNRLLITIAFSVVLMFPSMAAANAGIPMLFLMWPALGFALVPVIFFESWIVARYLGISYRAALNPIGAANVISTLFGVPIAWGLLVGLQFGTGATGFLDLSTGHGRFLALLRQFPWLPPYEGHLHWMTPAAAIMLLFVFFVSSCLLEIGLAYTSLREASGRRPSVAILLANASSYAGLICLTLLWGSFVVGA